MSCTVGHCSLYLGHISHCSLYLGHVGYCSLYLGHISHCSLYLGHVQSIKLSTLWYLIFFECCYVFNFLDHS